MDMYLEDTLPKYGKQDKPGMKMLLYFQLTRKKNIELKNLKLQLVMENKVGGGLDIVIMQLLSLKIVQKIMAAGLTMEHMIFLKNMN